MEELIVIKETVVKGYYEEPIYDHAPWLMYTNDVTHRLNPGDICYFDEEGRLFHESNEYGASLHDGTLCEFKFKRLEYFYSGISLSIRLLVNTLKHWNYGKKASV